MTTIEKWLVIHSFQEEGACDVTAMWGNTGTTQDAVGKGKMWARPLMVVITGRNRGGRQA